MLLSTKTVTDKSFWLDNYSSSVSAYLSTEVEIVNATIDYIQQLEQIL